MVVDGHFSIGHLSGFHSALGEKGSGQSIVVHLSRIRWEMAILASNIGPSSQHRDLSRKKRSGQIIIEHLSADWWGVATLPSNISSVSSWFSRRCPRGCILQLLKSSLRVNPVHNPVRNHFASSLETDLHPPDEMVSADLEDSGEIRAVLCNTCKIPLMSLDLTKRQQASQVIYELSDQCLSNRSDELGFCQSTENEVAVFLPVT